MSNPLIILDDFDLIRTQSQVTDARTNRKDDALERLLYRHHPDHQLMGGGGAPNMSYNPMKDDYYKDDFGTRSSSGVSTEPSEKMNSKQQQQQCQAQMGGPDNQPIYHSIVPPPAPQARVHCGSSSSLRMVLAATRSCATVSACRFRSGNR